MHGYQKPDRGWGGDPKRGAAMGRLSDLDKHSSETLTIRKVPIDEGGYDPGGTYWGIGQPLFCVSDGGSVSYLRATSFDDAKSKFPNASWDYRFVDADLEDMVQGYAEYAVELSQDLESEEDNPEFLDNHHSIYDLHESSLTKMKERCKVIVEREQSNGINSDVDWYQLGADAALDQIGSYGYLYVGVDGLIYMD